MKTKSHLIHTLKLIKPQPIQKSLHMPTTALMHYLMHSDYLLKHPFYKSLLPHCFVMLFSRFLNSNHLFEHPLLLNQLVLLDDLSHKVIWSGNEEQKLIVKMPRGLSQVSKEQLNLLSEFRMVSINHNASLYITPKPRPILVPQSLL
jgi:hypothetical protein